MMKVKPVKLGKTERMSFSHIDEVISMPNLIEVQKNSYQWFLDEGLKEVFHDIGTIEDYTGNNFQGGLGRWAVCRRPRYGRRRHGQRAGPCGCAAGRCDL